LDDLRRHILGALLLPIFILPAPVSGQAVFINIDEEQGLSSLQITDLFQDSHGFVWAGTPNGLNRFDGYDCVQYFNRPGDTASLSSSHISPQAFVEDADSNLWVATYRGGLNFFSRKTERFTHYRAHPGRPNSLSMDKLFAIESDGKGGFWIATAGRGINHFDPKTGAFRVWDADAARPGLLMGSTMTGALKLDKNGRLWIGTNKGACRFDPIDESFEYFPFAPGLDRSPSDWFVTAFLEDSRGNIWLGTARGLNRWDPGKKIFVKYHFGAVSSGSGKEFDYILDIQEDEDGSFWLGTIGGLLRYDPANGAIERFQHIPDDPFSIREGPVSCILKDRDGNLWFGTNNGVCILNKAAGRMNDAGFLPLRQAFKTIAQAEGINAVQEVKGALWLATQTGIFRFSYGGAVKRIGAGNFSALFYDSANAELYAGTVGDGFYVFDTEKQTLKKHVAKSAIGQDADPFTVKGHRLNGFAKDCKGYIWIATDGSLNRYDPSSGRFRKFQNQEKKIRNPSANTNHQVLPDSKGNLWIATMGGLSRLSKTELSKPFGEPALHFEHFLHEAANPNSISSDVVFCLLESRDGYLWVGTDAGLNRFDPQTGAWQWFFKTDGLASNEIVVLVEDRNGDLWAGSAHDGLTKLDRAGGRFFRFSAKDGLNTVRFRPNAGLCTADGFIVLGGRAGLAAFHPENLPYRRTASIPLYLTDFNIFNKSVPIGAGDNALAAPIYKTDALELDYGQSVFSFQFAALNFIHPEKQRYRFRLLPFQREWQYNGHEREATFTNLNPGIYRFEVESSENGYEWTGRSLDLRILPPWYRTRWAYVCYILAFGGLLYALRRYELRRLLAQAEARRLRETDLARTRLYANITHEFRTPLTIILGMEEQVRKDPATWLDNGLQLIRRNGKQLLHLVNQMLDLAKLESGHLPLRLVDGDVVRYIHYLTEAFHSYADSKDIRLHFHSGSAVLHMDHDPEKLQTVLSNLLSNAIKFTPAGGDVYVDLRVSHQDVRPERPGGQFIVVQVSDTGPGITPEHLPHIFNRYYQVDAVQGGEGTGIGLALVKELVRLMGGDIRAESEPGKGARFSVWLPLARTLGKTTAETPPEQRTALGETVFAQPENAVHALPADLADRYTVLLVEDNPDVVVYLSSVLAAHYQVETARNGQEGIDKAFELVPDIVVSDVMMPGKDGFELCGELKTDERTSHIPVILLTARADQRSRIEGLSRGADVYLAKPFQQEELLVCIENLIELRRRLQVRFQQAGRYRQSLESSPQSLDGLFLQKLARTVEAQLGDETFGLPQLCKALHMSRSNLFRKVKALTGKSVSDFIRSLRLEKARELLETTEMNVTEVCYAVGFSSPNYFSRAFQEAFGKPPSALRKR